MSSTAIPIATDCPAPFVASMCRSWRANVAYFPSALPMTFVTESGSINGMNFPAPPANICVHRLVYFERFQYMGNAIAREKAIQGWLRRNIALIEAENPLGKA